MLIDPVPAASGPSRADPGLMLGLDRQRRLSAGDYHRMIGAGILGEDDCLEVDRDPDARRSA